MTHKILVLDSSSHALLRKGAGYYIDLRMLKEFVGADEAIYYYQQTGEDRDYLFMNELQDAGWELNSCLGDMAKIRNDKTARLIESMTMAADLGGIVPEFTIDVEIVMGASYISSAGIVAAIRRAHPGTSFSLVAPIEYVSPDWHNIVDAVIDISEVNLRSPSEATSTITA